MEAIVDLGGSGFNGRVKWKPDWNGLMGKKKMKGKEVETGNIQKFFSMSFAIIREQNSGKLKLKGWKLYTVLALVTRKPEWLH